MQNPGTGHRSAELWDIGAERKIFLVRTLAAGFTQRKRIILVGSANYDFANSLPNFSDTICWGLCDDVFPHTSEHQLHHDKMFNMSANIEMLEMQSKHDKLWFLFFFKSQLIMVTTDSPRSANSLSREFNKTSSFIWTQFLRGANISFSIYIHTKLKSLKYQTFYSR